MIQIDEDEFETRGFERGEDAVYINGRKSTWNANSNARHAGKTPDSGRPSRTPGVSERQARVERPSGSAPSGSHARGSESQLGKPEVSDADSEGASLDNANPAGTSSRTPRRKAPGEAPLNRNAQRSLDLMERAFLTLVVQKPSDKITVADIAREAGLNRGTFYAHFGGIADLERYVMERLTQRVMDIAGEWESIPFFDDPMPILNELAKLIEEHRETFEKMAGPRGMEPLVRAAEHDLRKRVHKQIVEQYGDVEKARAAVVAADYIVNGITGAYQSWLNGDYGSHTLTDVNRELAKLIRATGQALACSEGSDFVGRP